MNIYQYEKAQIWMQVAYKILEKKRSLQRVNEHFSRKFYMRDAPNLSFSVKETESY
jgi:hypothetical protein